MKTEAELIHRAIQDLTRTEILQLLHDAGLFPPAEHRAELSALRVVLYGRYRINGVSANSILEAAIFKGQNHAQ